MTRYYIYPKDESLQSLEVELSEDEWFKVFLSGKYEGTDLYGIARADDETKLVIFEEATSGSKLP